MIQNIYFEGPVLWSQIDANRHLRHSAYADFAAQARVNLLNTIGLNEQVLSTYQMGPILFREELLYKREILMGDRVSVTCELTKSRADGSRFSFKQEIYRADGVLSAIVHVDGAWIHLADRKLVALPKDLIDTIALIPKSDQYEELPPSTPK